MTTVTFQPGKLVTLRGRDWVVLPSDDSNLLVVKPLGGSDEEVTGIYLPFEIPSDKPVDARFTPPTAEDIGDIGTAQLLYDSARLAFRNGAGPFRCLAKLSFRPRSYQMVPLIMALRQETVRLLIADDVGIGKTVESLLIVRELLERRKIKRFAVVCLPHLCEQWQNEIRAKLDLDAVIIRSNTQAGLDRQIQGDTSVYDYYPYQVISIDYIKSDVRRDVFIEQCPELVIVDEAHACARPSGASAAQQQRHHLIQRIAKKPEQSLILLTATPHSGKPEEFHSLLGLIQPEFEQLDLPTSSQAQRRELARFFIQRTRANVAKWADEDTFFPQRDTIEWAYDLSKDYLRVFTDILNFVRKLIAPDYAGTDQLRVQYWTALALLRGVMSSPAAGVEMLNTRITHLPENADVENGEKVTAGDADNSYNPVHDAEFGFEVDITPTQLLDRTLWTQHQRQELRRYAQELSVLQNLKDDSKLATAEMILEDWLREGFQTVVFCRYIATANYVGEQLTGVLQKKFPKLNLQVITSELPDEVRKQRIDEMGKSPQRVLIATDCLSEGVNLQDYFTAVLHYDLPWNPNRLEQREGRVDRFGQQAPTVKACLLYGASNPIDGIVLDVLLRKVREIRRAIGINVPFPEDSQSIIDTITHALFMNPRRKIEIGEKAHIEQLTLALDDVDEAKKAKASITRKVDEAAEREKISRSIFAQNAIKAQEIEADLRDMDEAIGNPKAVESFVTAALNNLLGVQVAKDAKGYRIVRGNLPHQLNHLLPGNEPVLQVSFHSPTPEGYYYLGRNHPFVEQLCQYIMANTLSRQGKRAARAAVIRTRQVSVKTTILLFRCRNVIEQTRGSGQIVAEEMVLWGWRGTPQQKEYLTHTESVSLLTQAKATTNLSSQARANFFENEIHLLDKLSTEFEEIAEQQSLKLVAAHERFSAVISRQHFQVVYPVLPMDLLGVYILLPEGGQSVGGDHHAVS